MSPTNPARDEIVSWLSRRLDAPKGSLEDLLEVPPDPEFGDFALPCFPFAKEMRMAPAQIAVRLADAFSPSEDVLDAKAHGPYLNFSVDRSRMVSFILGAVHEAGSQYGTDDRGRGRTIVIDYSSPNIAKHLGVHHLRSAIIGRALYRMFRAQGYRCVGINHLGDWGTSFGKLIAAFEKYGGLDLDGADVSDLQRLYVRYSNEAEDDPEMEDEARRAFKRLEEGEAEACRLWKKIKDISLREFERIYDMLGISFDAWTPESFYLEMSGGLIERLKGEGIAVESQGAVIVPLDAEDLPPMMLRKRDETTLYATRDLCAAEYRHKEYGFDKCLYVVGGEQKLHFQQLKATLARMGYAWADDIEHIDFGLLKFIDEESGQARVGSTRKGDVILLEDVLMRGTRKAEEKIVDNLDRLEEGTDLEELARQVGMGAIVFSDLSVRRNKDVVFDWDKMLDFQGDTGPYVQYAHARLCSILRKAGEDVDPDVDYDLLKLPEEWNLVRMVEAFPARLSQAVNRREPSVIANYLLELCGEFSKYYSAGMRDKDRRVLCDDGKVRSARLLLVDAVRIVIANGLELLGIAAPERM
jgi:arginyl-tRNA synthetase